MPKAEPEPEPEVVTEVLGYFVRNPRATDSLEGVARWRLLEEQVHRTLQQTETALAFLVSEGLLQEIRTPGSPAIFRLDPEHQADAVRFLSQHAAKRGERKR